MAKITKAIDWTGDFLNIYEQKERKDLAPNAIEHKWTPFGNVQQGTAINAELLNNFQKNGVYGILNTTKETISGVERYVINDFSGIEEFGVFEELKLKIKINDANINDDPKLVLNSVECSMIYSTETSFLNIKKGQLETNKIYNLIFNGSAFIVESSSLKATETSSGLIDLETIYESGMKFRGVFPYENKIMTYKEAMELKDGIYNIEGINNFNCLNIPPIGAKGINNFGILKKKTTQVISSSAQAKFQTTLEYSPHNYNFGVSSVAMHFWDKASELNKNLNTSYDASGLWTINVGWSGFNFSNPGYAKMANGLTIQWGVTAGSTSTADYKYFPIAFDNAVLTGIASYGIFGASGTGSAFEAVDKFKFLATHRNSSSAAVTGSVNWVAIGF